MPENQTPSLIEQIERTGHALTADGEASAPIRIKEKFFPSLFKKGRIYFVQGELTTNVKIGFTKSHPEQRLKALQVGSPDKLKLLGWCYGTRNGEMLLHGKFASQRLLGEWFSCSPDLLAFIQEVNGKAITQ